MGVREWLNEQEGYSEEAAMFEGFQTTSILFLLFIYQLSCLVFLRLTISLYTSKFPLRLKPISRLYRKQQMIRN